MALNKPNTQTTAQFETFEDTDMIAQETAQEATTTDRNCCRNSGLLYKLLQPTTAVQVAKPSALAVARPKGQLATALTNSNLFENELREAMASLLGGFQLDQRPLWPIPSQDWRRRPCEVVDRTDFETCVFPRPVRVCSQGYRSSGR